MSEPSEFPLLAGAEAVRPLVYGSSGARTTTAFLRHVTHLAADLPDASYAINACQDRYHFMVAFAALLVRKQSNLLPSSRTAGAFADVEAQFKGCYCLTDEVMEGLSMPQRVFSLAARGDLERPVSPVIAADHLAAVVFTSGSTGKPQANRKLWRHLVLGAQAARDRFTAGMQGLPAVVATVPPQHMYGLETSIMLPLACNAAVHSQRPLFPADVRAALEAVSPPRVLVSTPVHLKSCVAAALSWPTVAKVISATAPMPAALANRIEVTFGCSLYEIFGFSEAGSVASRRTLEDDCWTLYDGLSIDESDAAAWISGGHVPQAVPFADAVDVLNARQFKHLGRHEDLINVAGKRMSLADLNARLCALDGVHDGVFVTPPETGRDCGLRLGALVVAPGVRKRDLLDALRAQIDPVFLPRPLRLVEALPRNETGKLPRERLLAMLDDEDVDGS